MVDKKNSKEKMNEVFDRRAVSPAKEPAKRSAPRWMNNYGIELPPVFNTGEDGVNHINIYERGTTRLGMMLADEHEQSFVHPEFGPFRSIAGLWHYLKSEDRDDLFRTLLGKRIKMLARDKAKRHTVKDFKYTILMGHWAKVKAKAKIRTEMTASTLPFDYYYIYGSGLRIRSRNSQWLIAGLEEIRLALKEEREPNFEQFKDTPLSDVANSTPVEDANVKVTGVGDTPAK